MGHARLSASQTKRWKNCPGSTAYLEQHPSLDGGSGYHAQMGTAAHALVERCLAKGEEASDYENRLIEIIDPGGEEGTSILAPNAKMPTSTTRVVFIVDDDMIDPVQKMLNYVRNRCVELGLLDKASQDQFPTLGKAVQMLVEKGTVRLESHVDPLPERDDTGGTADVIIDAWPDVLEVVDYKNGSGVFVPVEGNDQLRSYALGSLQGEGSSDEYDRVRYTICQPRHNSAPANGIMYEETTVGELLVWKDMLAGFAARVDEARKLMLKKGASLDTLHEAGLLSPGADGGACRWCPMKTNCPAAMAAVQEQAAIDFADDPEKIEVPTAPEALATLLRWAPFLDNLISEATEEAKKILFSGGTVTGKKLVHGRSTRRWADVEEKDLVKTMANEFGVHKKFMFIEPKLITGPQAEKLVDKPLRKKFNADLLVKPDGKLTMVDETDSKPAVTVDPGSDFEGVED